MVDSDVGLLRFGGLINSLPPSVAKEFKISGINLQRISFKNLAANILFQPIEFIGKFFIQIIDSNFEDLFYEKNSQFIKI